MRLKSEFILREMGDTHILRNEGETVNLTRVIPLNETAAWLWKQAEDRDFSAEWLAEQLVDEYDIDLQTALEDVRELIDSLRQSNLIAEE